MAWVNDLEMVALVGIVDPPRKEAKDAIALCHDAGIRIRMITGDHATTAAAIADQLGIEGEAITGAEFAAMSDEELERRIEDIGVVARVAPEDKVRLVETLKRQNNVVAMTGDGVNDAPALKRADIGVAMGITGTEVTKEAGDMILTDDNFATIVLAVEGGRALYDNLMKYVRFQIGVITAFIALIRPGGNFRHCQRHSADPSANSLGQLRHRCAPGNWARIRRRFGWPYEAAAKRCKCACAVEARRDPVGAWLVS